MALAAEGVASSTWLGTEAVAARVAFDARRQQSLAYFDPVSNTPGFPRALARTLQELRLAGVEGRQLTRLPLAGPDLADLLDRVESSFVAASSADRAMLFALPHAPPHGHRSPMLWCFWISPTSTPPSASW